MSRGTQALIIVLLLGVVAIMAAQLSRGPEMPAPRPSVTAK